MLLLNHRFWFRGLKGRKDVSCSFVLETIDGRREEGFGGGPGGTVSMRYACLLC